MHKITLVTFPTPHDSWTESEKRLFPVPVQAAAGTQEICIDDQHVQNDTGMDINVLVVGIGGTGAPQSIEGAIGVTRRY